MTDKKLPASAVMQILESTGFDEDVADEYGITTIRVRNIRTGKMYRDLYDIYVAERGTPIRPVQKKLPLGLKTMTWLYRTRGEISDAEAGKEIGISAGTVRRIRAGETCRDVYAVYHKTSSPSEPTTQGVGRHWSVTRAWGVIADTLNGVKGRFAV